MLNAQVPTTSAKRIAETTLSTEKSSRNEIFITGSRQSSFATKTRTCVVAAPHHMKANPSLHLRPYCISRRCKKEPSTQNTHHGRTAFHRGARTSHTHKIPTTAVLHFTEVQERATHTKYTPTYQGGLHG